MGLLSFKSSAGPDQSAEKPRKKKKSARKRLYELHTWVGFHLAVVMVVVLFTGTMATVSNELDWLTQHDMRVSAGTEKVSYDEMLDSVRAYDPTATIISVNHMMGDHFAYRVTVFDENATQKFIHVNQWTGEVTGETPYFTLQRFFRDMHRYLYLPKVVGLTLVCSMAIILIISLYTGLKTTRNWGTLMTRIRFSKGARTAIGDAHKAGGLWSIWFFVLMITTGLWYYAEFLGSDFEPPVPNELREISEITSDVIVDPSAEEILRIAKDAYPELEVSGFNFSVLPGSAIRVMGKAGNPIVRERANAVYLHPETLDVLFIRRSSELPPVQWTNQIADPLHFGDFGGLPLKLVYFVFGLFLTGLSVSGVWLTWRRLKSRGASRMQIAALPIMIVSALFASITYTVSKEPIFAGLNPIPYALFVLGLFLAAGALACCWWLKNGVQKRGALSIKNAAIALLAIGMGAGAAHATLVQNPYLNMGEIALGRVVEGPVEASLYLSEGSDGAPSGKARFVVTGRMDQAGEMTAERLNTTRMTIDLLKDGGVIDVGDREIQRRFRVAAVSQPAFINLPTDVLPSATQIRATFEMASGSAYQITWDMPAP